MEADAGVSHVRRGRQPQYHVVDHPATESSSSSPSSQSRSPDSSTVVVDACWSSNNTEIESSKSNSSILHSSMWFRILIAIIVALVLGIIVLSSFIYQQQDSSSPSSSSSEVANDENAASATGHYHDDLGTLSWKALPPSDSVLTKVAFGSCMSQKMPQPHWDTLISSLVDPIDLLLLMGDNVYGDDCTEPTCQTLHQAYIDFERHASVQGAAPQLAVMATLDDHDYGQGDCHADNPYKDIAKSMFQKVFDISNDELPSSGDGVYRAKTWGPPGQRLQIIMLDTRYGRSPFFTSNSTSGNTSSVYYTPPPPDDIDYPQVMLSKSQWTWLHEQLLNQPADLRLIVSSIQVLNDVTGYECWRHLPKERQRLYDLLRQTQQIMVRDNNSTTSDVSNPEEASSSSSNSLSLAPILLLSGDRHVGGFYATDHDDDDDDDDSSNAILLHEVTASSWTHSFPLELHNDTCSATPALCEEDDPRRIGNLHHENNFATLTINWSQRTYTVALQKSDSTYGITYLNPEQYGGKASDAGSILDSHTFRF